MAQGKRLKERKSSNIILAVGCAEEPVISREQNAVANGYAMMRTSMFSSRTGETAVIGTIAGTRSVRSITTKNTKVTGKSVEGVGRILKPRCKYGTEPTSIILRNSRILPSLNQQGAQRAGG